MRWRVSIDVKAGAQTFHRASTTEAESFEGLMDQDLPELDKLSDELENEIDVADVTKLSITCERLR